MNRLIYTMVILLLILASCESSPRAFFSASPGDPVVGEEVWFTNESENAVDYQWDFGDGYISGDRDPIHKFTSSGTFTVVLKVWSSTGETSEASLEIKVKIPTLLEIEVLEYYDMYPVSSASVILYPGLDDWEKEKNMIGEGFTDSEGKVVFADLAKKVHYVDVWEKDHDNYTLAEEDIGFIRTPEIIPNKINRFIAYVDFVSHGKAARRGHEAVVRKIIRKADDARQPEATAGTAGWEKLYAKRVR